MFVVVREKRLRKFERAGAEIADTLGERGLQLAEKYRMLYQRLGDEGSDAGVNLTYRSLRTRISAKDSPPIR